MLRTWCEHHWVAPLHGGPRASQENHPHSPPPQLLPISLTSPDSTSPHWAILLSLSRRAEGCPWLMGPEEAADRRSGGGEDAQISIVWPRPLLRLAALTPLNSLPALASSGPSATCFPHPPTHPTDAFKGAKPKTPPSNKESYNYSAATCPW